jgi:hypothetical protein
VQISNFDESLIIGVATDGGIVEEIKTTKNIGG